MIKKKILFSAIVSLILFVLTACGGGSNQATNSNNNGEGSETDSGSASEESMTLVVATGLSAQHGWYAGFFVPWMEKVTEETNGRVQFETFTSGELIEVTHELEGIRQGLADIVLLLPIYDPQRFPMAEVTMLPLTHSDTHIASNAYKKLLESDVPIKDGKTYYELEFADKDIFALALPTTQEYSISTTGHEFNSVNDINGTTLRTASRIHEMYASRTGIGTVTMPAVDMFDAMSRGAFEGSFYSIADWTGYGFQDLFTYTLTGVNFGHFNSVLAMTQEKWESLPEDIREVMVNAYEDLFDDAAEEWVKRADEVIEYSTENGGKFVDINELDSSVQEYFVDGVENTWYDYIDLLEERDVPGKDVVTLWRDLLLEEGGQVPKAILDLE